MFLEFKNLPKASPSSVNKTDPSRPEQLQYQIKQYLVLL